DDRPATMRGMTVATRQQRQGYTGGRAELLRHGERHPGIVPWRQHAPQAHAVAWRHHMTRMRHLMQEIPQVGHAHAPTAGEGESTHESGEVCGLQPRVGSQHLQRRTLHGRERRLEEHLVQLASLPRGIKRGEATPAIEHRGDPDLFKPRIARSKTCRCAHPHAVRKYHNAAHTPVVDPDGTVMQPTFKGVWSTAVNFVLSSPPGTKLGQYP